MFVIIVSPKAETSKKHEFPRRNTWSTLRSTGNRRQILIRWFQQRVTKNTKIMPIRMMFFYYAAKSVTLWSSDEVRFDSVSLEQKKMPDAILNFPPKFNFKLTISFFPDLEIQS